AVTDQLSEASATSLPISAPSARMVIIVAGSAVPTKIGAASLVMPSLFEAPVSRAGSSAGVEGVAGGTATSEMTRTEREAVAISASSVWSLSASVAVALI